MSGLKSRVTFLLLGLWLAQSTALLGLMAVAEGSHHVSVVSSGGALVLVLHHHETEAAVDGHAFESDDHAHGDHVVRSQPNEALASRVTHLDTPLEARVVVPTLQVASGSAVAGLDAASASGPAPPPRTVILRI